VPGSDKNFVPAFTTVQESYKQHAEPYVIQGTEYAVTEYSRLLKPHVVTAKEKAEDYLHFYVAPHASTIKQVYITDVKPRVEVGKDPTHPPPSPPWYPSPPPQKNPPAQRHRIN
jgi:hypothetical protein